MIILRIDSGITYQPIRSVVSTGTCFSSTNFLNMSMLPIFAGKKNKTLKFDHLFFNNWKQYFWMTTYLLSSEKVSFLSISAMICSLRYSATSSSPSSSAMSYGVFPSLSVAMTLAPRSTKTLVTSIFPK